MAPARNMIEVASDQNCNRDCVECVPQFATSQPIPPIPRDLLVQSLSNADASRLAADFAKQIETNRTDLIKKLTCYADTIAARWRKKNKQKRVSDILAALPGLYHHKWPELRAQFGYDNFEGRSEAAFVALKDDPNKLLSLLHLRTSHSPETWVMFDVAQMKHGAENGTLARNYNPNCVVMYGKDYGKLVLWDRVQCHRWHCIGFPRAALVLEAQATLLGFLSRVVDLIMAPGSDNKTVQNSSVTTPEGFRGSGQVEFWSSMANQAFSPPPAFEPFETLRQAQAQLAAAEDHLYLLQADPSYIHGILTKQKRAEVFTKASSKELWKILVGDLMVYPITHVLHLRDLVDECEHVATMYGKYRDGIVLGSALPKEYERSLMALELLCINLYLAQSKRLPDLLPKSPGFSRNYKYVPAGKGKVGHTLRTIGADSGEKGWVNKAYYLHEPLHFALLMLEQDPQDNNAFNIPYLMSFIDDHLANAEAKERARIDQTLYDHLARMSVYAEIWLKLRMHRPAPFGVPFSYDVMTDDEKKRRTWLHWRSTPGNPTMAEYDELSQQLKSFHDAGVPAGKHDQKWLTGMKTARSALSDFWAAARKVRQREVTGVGFSAQHLKEDAALFSAETGPRYSADLADDLASLMVSHEKAASEDLLFTPQTTWGSTTNEKVVTSVSVKTKTRPENSTSSTDALVIDSTEFALSPTTKISVNAESIRTFAKMFPGNAESAYKGIVKWQQFVTAMVDAGCSAKHIGGSMVSFEVPEGVRQAGRIVFHKPHPEQEVDLMMLRAMGKRMRA
ncbi:hypothetical protein LTR86_009742 [Recurvomyces mirabilis]|nr:hypothetical protein LTR86_009742 [Recurvomyces mirabilis]